MPGLQMTFTDDDLKRLREEIPNGDYCHEICLHCGYDMKALLARLEAASILAERYAKGHSEFVHDTESQADRCDKCKEIRTWRKACGVK